MSPRMATWQAGGPLHHATMDDRLTRRIESYLLDGAAGKIECLPLEEPESGPVREACLVCHVGSHADILSS